MKYTWKHLTDLMDAVVNAGYTNEITTVTLNEFIAKHISISEVTQKKFVGYLAKYGFIKEKVLGIWIINYPKVAKRETETQIN